MTLVNIFANHARIMLANQSSTIAQAAEALDEIVTKITGARYASRKVMSLFLGPVSTVLNACRALPPVSAEHHALADSISRFVQDSSGNGWQEFGTPTADAEAFAKCACDVLLAAAPDNAMLKDIQKRLKKLS